MDFATSASWAVKVRGGKDGAGVVGGGFCMGRGAFIAIALLRLLLYL
jgi:hypothetical protein